MVCKDVEPYAIVGGNPTHVIRYRFAKDLIDELLKVDYSKLTPEEIKLHENDLYSPLKSVDQIAWMPKKSK